eukprot:3118678-Ditylum_brightwellii.AAC.1
MAPHVQSMDQDGERVYQIESIQIGGETKTERQRGDRVDGYEARKSLNEWFNNNIVRIKLLKAPRKEYKLLVVKRGKRKRYKSMIRRKRKERLGRNQDRDDKDDDRKYKKRK